MGHYIKLCCDQTTGGNPVPSAYFVVRAIVTDASKRAAFDRWYETEHVPDALNKLVADFNRDWPEVKRSRETLVLAQEFDATS